MYILLANHTPTLFRPSADELLAEITGLIKRYEDDFDIFQGRGKLDIMDELLQGGETEIRRSSSFSSQPQIQVCFLPTING